MKPQLPHKRNSKPLELRMKPDVYYVWVGGSCDYGREERTGGGAYLMQLNGETIDRFVVSDFHTTEFRMMLTAMIHAMQTVPEQSDILFLTNVAYLQNFDQTPNEKAANTDLLAACREVKKRLQSASVKIVSYHKYRQLPETHEMAHQAMLEKRQSYIPAHEQEPSD